MASNTNHPTLIDSAIDSLQSAIQETRVPGELEQWLSPVRDALAQIRRVLRGEAAPRHRRDYSQIAKEVSLRKKKKKGK